MNTYAPNGLTEILHFYGAEKWDSEGNVTVPNEWNNNIVPAVLPRLMPVEGTPHSTGTILIHHALRGSLQSVLKNLEYTEPESYSKLEFSGSFVPRLKRGIDELSMHGLGAAVDFNAESLPMDRGKIYAEADAPEWFQTVIHQFRVAGWKWGGDFGDPMHFQYGTGY